MISAKMAQSVSPININSERLGTKNYTGKTP